MAARHDRSSQSLDPASVARSRLSAAVPPPPLLDGAAGPQVDVLSDVLRTVRLTGALFFPRRASPPWADEVPAAAALTPTVLPEAQHVVSYHVVTKGTCWAIVGGHAPVRLDPGAIVVIPHGDSYVMGSAPDVRSELPVETVLAFFRQVASGCAPSVVTDGADGPDCAELVCGFLGCDARPFNPVLEALPRLVHLPPRLAAPDPLTHLIDFALAESRDRQWGARCVLLRLSEVLFVEVVRRYVATLPPEGIGWLAGLRDPVVGHALAFLHERPAHGWTLEQLARRVGVSRSVLADRFTRFAGHPPMRYLARWRVQLAARALAEGAVKVSAVALDVGYDSEAAFSRAFKRITGTSPVTWRRRLPAAY